jgi:putative sigma-54 modulation protein
MIKTDITSRNLEADKKIKSYVKHKIGELERFIPRRQRNSMSATVVLTDDPSGREDNRFVCDAIVTVQGQQFIAKEGTVNIFAAVDIVEAKLKSQLKEYKDKQAPRRGKLMGRLFRRAEESIEATEGQEA